MKSGFLKHHKKFAKIRNPDVVFELFLQINIAAGKSSERIKQFEKRKRIFLQTPNIFIFFIFLLNWVSDLKLEDSN